jgi:hypothetical protein
LASAADASGSGSFSFEQEAFDSSVSPKQFMVSQSYPNPFTGRASIRFGIPVGGMVTVEVYDVRGAKVATLLNEHKSPGYHTVTWGGLDSAGQPLPSGIYLYRVLYGGKADVKKVTLVR